MSKADAWLDQFANADVFKSIAPDRRRPLVEAARLQHVDAGEILFQQFHPATRFYLLLDGTATQSTGRTNAVQFDPVDWPFAALGWSGFLRPNRYGSTVTAQTDLELLSFDQETLASIFYSDPALSICFFSLILDSVRRQLTSVRASRIDMSGASFSPPEPGRDQGRRPVVGRADSVLRRTAFFAAFDDDIVEQLAERAELLSFAPGSLLVKQDEFVDGLLVLASGSCTASFESPDPASRKLLPFRRFRSRQGIVAGLPGDGQTYSAEATVYAESHCWVYRVPADALQHLVDRDPEFGRAFQQRLLARMAGLIAAIRMERNYAHTEPEIALVTDMLANGSARLPVTSTLHKVPHLLAHRLTVGNAFAALRQVGETGSYHERLLAARCDELLSGVAAEHAFYQGILEACQHVIDKDETASPEKTREECDRLVLDAFGYLDIIVDGGDNWPESGGNVVILNHLACPEYYQLPNGYHFSFDTAFVSALVWQRYGRSAVRVVRQSPDAEFGHNLFYSRLGHITVPTVESELEGVDEEAFRALRREAGRRFGEEGRRAISSGTNVIICPEGQSQPAELSPARFHTGAFRLALETGAQVVPIALAGFDRRYKVGPLVATILPPVSVTEWSKENPAGDLRAFADELRDSFKEAVLSAQALAAGASES